MRDRDTFRVAYLKYRGGLGSLGWGPPFYTTYMSVPFFLAYSL